MSVDQPEGEVWALSQYEQRWNAGNHHALIEAVKFCFDCERPLPSWAAPHVMEALIAAYHAPMTRGRAANPAATDREADKHHQRWYMVRSILDRSADIERHLGIKMNKTKAYEEASKRLKGTPAWGNARMVRESFKRMEGANASPSDTDN